MEIKDVDTLVEKLTAIEQLFGVWGVVFIIVIVILSIITWHFLTKKIESIAEEASEKSMKKLQAQLDKEFVKFSTKHQKQVDAIHETFQELQKVTSLINFLIKGDKFTKQLSAKDRITYLVSYRNNFKKIYSENRLIFPLGLCNKIDMLIPAIDSFIEIYEGGLLPDRTEEEIEFSDEVNGGLYITGFWSVNAFDQTLEQLDVVSKEIEKEFRQIYGTND